MNLSDFNSNSSFENNSKKGLFDAVLPFDFNYEESTGKLEITSVGKDIYFTGANDPSKGYINGLKYTATGHALLNLGFIKNSKERTFDHVISNYDNAEESKKNSRILQIVRLIGDLRGKPIDMVKESFEFHSFKEFMEGILKLIEPKQNKVNMALEWREEESEYANYQLAILKEGSTYFPNIVPSGVDARIDLMAKPIMYVPVENNEEQTTVNEESIEDLLTVGTDEDWLN